MAVSKVIVYAMSKVQNNADVISNQYTYTNKDPINASKFQILLLTFPRLSVAKLKEGVIRRMMFNPQFELHMTVKKKKLGLRLKKSQISS